MRYRLFLFNINQRLGYFPDMRPIQCPCVRSQSVCAANAASCFLSICTCDHKGDTETVALCRTRNAYD